MDKPMATMTESDLTQEIESVRELCRPMWTALKSFSDAELVGSGRVYSPCGAVRELYTVLLPLERKIELLKAELQDRERQRLNSAAWDRKAAAIATAPVYQSKNGWEIVRLDPTMPVYNVRDPYTKEEVYTGCLRRCREVAGESRPCQVTV